MCSSNILLGIIGLLIVLIVYLSVKKESFVAGCGSGFAQVFNPVPRCRNSNNCFKGSKSRFTYYSNMCEPDNKNMLREKIKLRDPCLRKL
jgi:hypothetical protein